MTDYALMTDQYELMMLDALIKEDRHERKAVFEVFARSLPQGRRYGVFAGLGRLLPMIEAFEFSGDTLRWIRETGMVSKETYTYLADYKFRGTITAYREGDIYFPNSPVLTVEGTMGECILLETLILSVLNSDSAIATTAARMVSSAMGRPIIEMGSRRTNEDSAVAAARAAYIAGFASTSNLLAGKRYGVPTTGTAAHAFTLAHEDERTAFAAQVKAQGINTTLLVDTYDIEEGIRNAVEVAGTRLGGIRLDSGDLFTEAVKARKQLDGMGALGTRIVVTSDLDEYVIKDLRDAPVNGYGVGTKLVSSNPVGFVYKLVAIEDPTEGVGSEVIMRPVAKKAKDKASVGGKKRAFRVYNGEGKIVREVYTTSGEDVAGRALQEVALDGGKIQVSLNLHDTRDFHALAKGELPIGEQNVWFGDFGPYLKAEHVEV